MKRRADGLRQQVDAGGIDVDAPELAAVRLGQEVLQRAPGAAPEVKHTLARKRPVVAEQVDDRLLGLGPELLPQLSEAFDPAGFR